MLTPLPPERWNYECAAHLLNRAGFGGTPEQVEGLRKFGLAASVRRLIDDFPEAANVPAPEWAVPEDLRDKRMDMRAAKEAQTPEAREKIRAMRMEQGEHLLDLRRWWLERMMNSPAPLIEKMTLFWHGHFATSAEKVKNAFWLWLQNDTLRRNALGNFVSLTKAISRDPAMMIYLDLQQSRPQHPNENWARELMELFTVGIENYSEMDVTEAARAFTGYRLNPMNQQFRFAPFQCDAGNKTLLGVTGPLGGDEVIDILAKQPACAQFIARKLWRFFAEDQPAPPIIDAVAARLRAENFELRPVLREIFSSAQFYSTAARHSQIKSPVQFLIQTNKQLGAELPATIVAQNAMRQMGQILFAPPNVKGWDGGKAWISTSTLLFRYNFANYLINGEAMRPGGGGRQRKGGDLAFRPGLLADIPPRAPVDVNKFIPPALREKPDELVANLSLRFFGRRAPEKEHRAFVKFLEQRADTSDETIRGLLHLMTSTPQFQLA